MLSTVDPIDINAESDVITVVRGTLQRNTPRMYLTTTAEAFMAYRAAISQWLYKSGIHVEVLLWSQSQKVRLLFENTSDAWSFQEEFEGF